MKKNFLAVWGALVLCVASSQAVTLKNAAMSVEISDATGQVVRVESGGVSYVAQSEDRYALEDATPGSATETSSESADCATSWQRDKENSVALVCENVPLNLRLEKRYRLRGNVLQKQTRYTTLSTQRRLLRVSSRTLLDANLLRDGFYYVPTNDGYKVRTVPFTAARDVTAPTPWLVSTGEFVFTNPKRNRVLTHYRQLIDGQPVYGEAESGIESQFLPGGAITALGAHFVDAKTAFSLTSHYAVLDGDGRDYHRHRHSLPPYANFQKWRVPTWFRGARMYLGDGLLGSGQGLLENRELIKNDLENYLALLKNDESLMVFFNHWSMSGDYPFEGQLRYLDAATGNWSAPVPVEKLRENIRWLKAISPRIKVGGYVYYSAGEESFPFRQHKDDWFIDNKEGRIAAGGDGFAWSGELDFSSGYREYSQNQLRRALTDTGFDWLHLDTIVREMVNWKTKNVVQGSAFAGYLTDLARYAHAHDKAIIQNTAPYSGLWADGSYFEVQQPERWEKTDWRILAVPAYEAMLARTHKPDSWVNLVYGTTGIFGLRNAFAGHRGWIRNANTWWRWTPQALAYEKLIDQLLEAKLSDARVSPSWWKMETPKLEAEALQIGGAQIIPLLWHDEAKTTQEISFDATRAGFKKGAMVFSFDWLLAPSQPADAFEKIPLQSRDISLLKFSASVLSNAEYSRTVELGGNRNYYHIATQVPAWVHRANETQSTLLLPQTRGVSIRGALQNGATNYELRIVNQNRSAQILAYLPKAWKGAQLQVNGAHHEYSIVKMRGEKGALFSLPRGAFRVVLSSAPAGKTKTSAYWEARSEAWEMATHRLAFNNLKHRAFGENGRSVLRLSTQNGESGSVWLPYVNKEKSRGVSLAMRGQNSGAKVTVKLSAGDVWTHQIRDDFSGWKTFDIARETMQADGAKRRWEETTALTLEVQSAAKREIDLADIHLIPALPDDFPQTPRAKKRLEIQKTSATIAVDGSPSEAAWNSAPVVTGFYKLGAGDAPSPSLTRVRALYDDANLYLLMENLESIETLGTPQPRDAQIWNSDHVELFLNPNGAQENWYQILVDAAGTIQDIHYTRAGQNLAWNGDVQVKTGLNWKASWVAEWKIPFAALGKTPQAGEVWGINFARKDNANEWSNWASTGEWLDPETFGEAHFGGAP